MSNWLLLFVTLPFIELFLLMWLAQLTSSVFAIALVVLTGVYGATLAKKQGARLWRRIEQQLADDRVPVFELLEGLGILAAVLLLITPGLLTDAVGLLLLVSPVRRWLCKLAFAKAKQRAKLKLHKPAHSQDSCPSHEPVILEANFTRSHDNNDFEAKQRRSA